MYLQKQIYFENVFGLNRFDKTPKLVSITMTQAPGTRATT